MKKNTMKTALFIALLTMLGYNVNAQNKELKVGSNPTIKQPSAVLEVESANKGVLMPRVALTNINDTATIPAPANALTVFNTATAGIAPNDVTPGYYYWSTADNKWIKLLNEGDMIEPWQVQGTTDKATDNAQNIYQTGSVAIGKNAVHAGVALDVEGAVRGGTGHLGTVGANSMAFGQMNTASGSTAISLGFNNTASGSLSTVIGGGNNTVSASFSIAGGNDNQVRAIGSGAFGTGLIISTSHTYSFAFGFRNAITTSIANPIGTNVPIFQIGNGIGSGRNNALTIMSDARTAIGVSGTEVNAKPTELLDLGGVATAGNGGLKIRNINSAAYTGNAATDKIVVADADGVFKTVPATTFAASNIYTADGSLTSARTLTQNSFPLTFQGSNERTRFAPGGGLFQQGITGAGTFGVIGADLDSNGRSSQLLIQAFSENVVNITATGDTRGLNIITNSNTTDAPIMFMTTPGGGTSNAQDRMIITGSGNIGIANTDPSERLDVTGNVRIRDINTSIGGATDRIVVADIDGVLKTVAAPTSAAIRTVTANYTTVAADETILVNATSGAVTVSLPATPTTGKKYNVKKIDGTANAVNVSGNGHNIDGNATVSGTLPYQGWVMQYDGTNWFIISRI